MATALQKIYKEIKHHPSNAVFLERGWAPVYAAHPNAKILIVGQAPGRIAQATGVPWNDRSGDTLRAWMGVGREIFYDETKVALVPMDFYFPGSLARGDVAPRAGFAAQWHPLILKEMPDIQLTLLIGQYSQAYYLGNRRKPSLGQTVRAFREYLPDYLPLVHPSPRNFMWQKKHPWFIEEVIPTLRERVHEALNTLAN